MNPNLAARRSPNAVNAPLNAQKTQNANITGAPKVHIGAFSWNGQAMQKLSKTVSSIA